MLPGFGPGDVVAGRYRIEELVGRGGFGAVYRATQLNLGRPVALKVLLPELVLGRGSERFRQEAELAQRLEHPNSVRVYDFGSTEHGLPFIAWEFLRGRTLEQLILSEGPVAAWRVARIGSQVLKALMEAHALGIVHRDIKPSNVMLCDYAGESDFVKLLDLGVAKVVAQDNRDGLTGAGHLVGTPSYMSPELVLAGTVTPQVDLYALGLTLADALAGAQTVRGSSFMEICMRQASETPVELPALVLGSALCGVIQRSVQKNPAARYASAEEMLRDIEALSLSSREIGFQPTAAVTQLAVAPSAGVPTPQAIAQTVSHPAPSRRSSLPWLLAAVVLGVSLLGAAGVIAFVLAERGKLGALGSDPVDLGSLDEATARQRIAAAGFAILDVQHTESQGYSGMMITVTKLPYGGSVTIAEYDSPGMARYSAEVMRDQGYPATYDDRRVVFVSIVPKDEQGERLLRELVAP